MIKYIILRRYFTGLFPRQRRNRLQAGEGIYHKNNTQKAGADGIILSDMTREDLETDSTRL